MKKVLMLFIATLLLIFTVACTSSSKPTGSTATETTISDIMTSTGMSQQKAAETYDIFQALGGSKKTAMYSITPDESLDNLAVEGSKGYRIKTEFSDNVVLNVFDGSIYSIRYEDKDYYINGEKKRYFYNIYGDLNDYNDTSNTNNSEDTDTNTDIKTMPSVEVSKIMTATGMTEEKAAKAYEAFEQVSDKISVIYSITYDDGLDDLAIDGAKGYRIKTEFSNNVILYVLNGSIFSIRYADYDYYIDGKVNGYFYDRNGKLIAGQKP